MVSEMSVRSNEMSRETILRIKYKEDKVLIRVFRIFVESIFNPK